MKRPICSIQAVATSATGPIVSLAREWSAATRHWPRISEARIVCIVAACATAAFGAGTLERGPQVQRPPIHPASQAAPKPGATPAPALSGRGAKDGRTLLAQSTAPSRPQKQPIPVRPEFEVASVRASGQPSQTTGLLALARNALSVKGGPGTDDPEQLTIRRMPLRMLLYTAYGVRPDQISGPDWLDSELFDIAAKVAPGTTKEQANAMLQNLLIERFEITFHRITKDLPGYELTVAKNGAKLKEMAEAAPSLDAASPKPEKRFQVDLDAKGFPIIPEGRNGILAVRNKEGLNRMTCHACSVAELISRITVDLAVPMGSPVSPYAMAGHIVDKTELNGKYDFHLEYSGGLVGAALQPLSVDDQAVSSPDLFTALEKQLGLKLQKTKLPMDVLVIDHADKTPTDN